MGVMRDTVSLRRWLGSNRRVNSIWTSLIQKNQVSAGASAHNLRRRFVSVKNRDTKALS